MWGPRYKRNVCNPEPNPIEEAIPKETHHIINIKISNVTSKYYVNITLWCNPGRIYAKNNK